MSQMVERVAYAIYEQQHGVSFDLASEPEKRAQREIARAAIEAMREPTTEMMTAIGYPNYPDGWSRWGAMIDEALK